MQWDRTFRAGELGCFILGCLVLTACATTEQQSRTKNAYRDSTTSTLSEAPAKFAPPEKAQPIDAGYLSAQADYHFALGDAMSLDGNANGAIEEFKLALIYAEKSATIRLRLASEYVRKSMVSEALDQAQTALRIEPNRVDARMLIAGLYSAVKNYEVALAEYETVLRLEPNNSDAMVYRGALLAEQRKYSEAIAQFQKLATLPNEKGAVIAHYYLAKLYAEMPGPGSLEKSEREYKKALQEKPNFAEAALGLNDIYLKTDRRSEAVRLLKRFQSQFGPNAIVAEQLGKYYLEDEKYEEAYAQFVLQEDADPENLNTKVKVALILIEMRRHEESAAKLEEILAKVPSSDKIRFYLGAVYEELKRFPQAIEQFALIPVESSFYNEAVIHKAYLQKLAKNYPEAMATVRKGIAVKPDVPQFYALYASFLDDTKDFAKAASVLEDSVARFPENAQLQFFLGSIYERLQNVEGTIRQMKRVLDLDAKHVQALNFLAYTFAEHNIELVEAERLSRKALEFQPNDGYIMDTLGWILFKVGRTSEALKILEAAHQKQPRESVIAEHLGDVYSKSELPEKARLMYQRAAELESNQETKQKIKNKMAAIEKQSVQKNPLREPTSYFSTPSLDSYGRASDREPASSSNP